MSCPRSTEIPFAKGLFLLIFRKLHFTKSTKHNTKTFHIEDFLFCSEQLADLWMDSYPALTNSFRFQSVVLYDLRKKKLCSDTVALFLSVLTASKSILISFIFATKIVPDSTVLVFHNEMLRYTYKKECHCYKSVVCSHFNGSNIPAHKYQLSYGHEVHISKSSKVALSETHMSMQKKSLKENFVINGEPENERQ